MAQAKLNPKYFTQRGFIHVIIPKKIREVLKNASADWQIKETDLTYIFIKGENINGTWTNKSPFIINLYFEKIIASDETFMEFMREFESKLFQNQIFKNLKVELEYTLDPKTLPTYYDLDKDRIVVNQEYRQYMLKPKPKQVFVQVPIEEEPTEEETPSIAEVSVKTQKTQVTQKVKPIKKTVAKRTEEEKAQMKKKREIPESFEPFIDKPYPEANIFETISAESQKIYAYTVDNLEEAKEWLDVKFGLKKKEETDNKQSK